MKPTTLPGRLPLNWAQRLICRLFAITAVQTNYLKAVERNEQLYREQLTVILINNGGELKDLKYEDISNVNLYYITITIGLNRCRLFRGPFQGGNLITNETELPRI